MDSPYWEDKGGIWGKEVGLVGCGTGETVAYVEWEAMIKGQYSMEEGEVSGLTMAEFEVLLS